MDKMPAADEPRGEKAELDLEEFMRLLPHLEGADLMAMSAAYQNADLDERNAARALAATAAKNHRLGEELNRLQSSIIQWAGSDISRSSAITLAGVRPDQVLGDLRMQAVPPLLDAATALLLKDALSDDHRALLLEPLGAALD